MIKDIIDLGLGQEYLPPTEHCRHCVVNDNFSRGDRVKFHHLIFGDQTGSVHHLLESTPPRAIILVDHRLRNVYWSVPLSELSPLELVPA